MKPPNSPRTEEQAYLAAIWEAQLQTNSLLSELVGNGAAEPKTGVLLRSELIARVKELPEKPKGWTKLPNDKLMELLKRGEG